MMWGIARLAAFATGVVLLWDAGVLAAAYDMLYDALLGAFRTIQEVLYNSP